MRFVRKTELFLSQPAVYKQYACGKARASREADVYGRIAEQYHLKTVEPGDGDALMFPDEPCIHVKEIGSRMQEAPHPAYFVCCYASHPLTEKINAALYMLKELNLAGTQPISFSDAGWISPVIALHWADAVQDSVWAVCMEQLTRYRPPVLAGLGAYPLAEALAIACISPHEGEWRICGYALEQFGEVDAGGVDALVRRAVRLAEEVLQAGQASPRHTAVLPQMLGDSFVAGVRAAFPGTFSKGQAMNQGTADLWYALDEFGAAGDGTQDVLLLYADPLHGIGCVLLQKEETS